MFRPFARWPYCTAPALASIVVVVLAWVAPAAAQDGAPVARFQVFLSGRAIGTESVAVRTDADGTLTIVGSGRLEAPVNLDTQKVEIRYDSSRRPLSLAMAGVLRSETLAMDVGFADGVATAAITRGTETTTTGSQIPERPVVLSDSFFASYEAMAERLGPLEPGSTINAYFAGQGSIPVVVDRILDERIQTPSRTIAAKRHQITFLRPTGPFNAEVWTDEHGRLLRLSLPLAGIETLREDIATVNARRETMSRAGDEDVRIPSAGFSLAATLSKPSGDRPPRGYPAIILIPSSASQDRDDGSDGIPVAGLIAAALADAGHLVVRYDRRGVAQSGGRPESAGLEDYALDVRSAVKYLADRDDVDDRRIGVIGRGDGGTVALQAAAHENDIAWLVLVGTAATPGTELVLERQATALESLGLTLEEREQRIDLQKRINSAVQTGEGWDGIAPDVRRQANTAWFRSFLRFDPADAMRRTRQPMLILQPEQDRDVGRHHADRLAELARARKGETSVDLLMLTGVDDRLVESGAVQTSTPTVVSGARLSPTVVNALVDWLATVAATGRR
jgi:pimeloyl-ACP methyl ester carboxylesterase